MPKYHGVLWQTKQSECVHLIVKQTSYSSVTSGVSDLSLDSPLCPRPSPVPQWQTSDIPLIFISGSWARPAPDQGNQSREHLEMNRHCSYRYGSNGWKRLTEVSATLKCPIIVSYSYEICSLLLGGRLCKHQRFIGNCFNNYYSGQWH